ncbi:unnamed protein product [marine sediment metagenome]|uniref:Uncharacterized protein n=1 Tax=marine sediment metagenome TaxID=412755 RepID=X0WZV6_9ZZZZ
MCVDLKFEQLGNSLAKHLSHGVELCVVKIDHEGFPVIHATTPRDSRDISQFLSGIRPNLPTKSCEECFDLRKTVICHNYCWSCGRKFYD